MENISTQQTLKTSISIRKFRLKRLKNAQKELGVSMKDLLSVLIYKARKLVGTTPVTLETVDYQQRLGKKHYKIYKVSFYTVDHEYLVNTRTLFKVSGSLLLSRAIDEFLDDILEKGISRSMKLSPENTEENNYVIHRRDYAIFYSQNDEKEFWLHHWDKQIE